LTTKESILQRYIGNLNEKYSSANCMVTFRNTKNATSLVSSVYHF
jgi:hypothetical protein